MLRTSCLAAAIALVASLAHAAPITFRIDGTVETFSIENGWEDPFDGAVQSGSNIAGLFTIDSLAASNGNSTHAEYVSVGVPYGLQLHVGGLAFLSDYAAVYATDDSSLDAYGLTSAEYEPIPSLGLAFIFGLDMFDFSGMALTSTALLLVPPSPHLFDIARINFHGYYVTGTPGQPSLAFWMTANADALSRVSDPATVPEPASLTLLALGGLAGAVGKRLLRRATC